MNINFSKHGVITTTLNQETFLTFKYDTNDGSANIYIKNVSDSSNLLYINGIPSSDILNDNTISNMKLNSSLNIASYHIFVDANFNYDASLTISYKPTNGELKEIIVPIYNRPYIINELNSEYENGNSLNNVQTSAMLIRTNPKLTGNIKLVIDSNSKMYLDTFKISDILSNKNYRKKEVSSEDYFSNSIRNVFETLPKGDLYKVADENYYAFNSLRSFEKQYITTYTYGAKTNDDELYNENFSILAPLWVNQNLPDYFLIFRVDGPYENNINLPAIDIFKKYISKAKLIKSFNLQNDSPVGKFLRNHLSEAQVYPGSTYISFNNKDNLSWYGIAVDKGVIAERVETPYFANKINNQTWANYYISNGFERNNLISSNLINIEFMFDDNDASLYSLNRYFGVYVKRNDFSNGYYIKYYNQSNDLYETVFIEDKDVENFNNIIKDNTPENSSLVSYDDKIFCMLGPDYVSRISYDNISNKNTYLSTLDSFVNKPYLNIISTPITEVNINKEPFITLTINNVLNSGEHLRILGSIINGSNVVYEVIASNSDLIATEPYIYPYETLNETNDKLKVYRTVFYSNVDGFDDPIAEQVKRIVKALNEVNVNNDYEIVSYNKNTISIINKNDNYNLIFQRINSNVLNSHYAKDEDITYFGNLVVKSSELKWDNYELDNTYKKFTPLDFELWGDRETYIINFALGNMIGDNNDYYLYAINSDSVKDLETITLYQALDSSNNITGYEILYNFEISYYIPDESGMFTKTVNILKNNVLNYNDLSTSLICSKDYRIYIPNNTFNGYSVYPLSFSLMGYIPIKDFDFTIYQTSVQENDPYSTLNFEGEKIINFPDSYLTSNINTDANYSFIYNDGSIGLDATKEKYLLKNKVYKVISGEGTIEDNSGNTYSITEYSVFNTFDISTGFKYLRATKDSSITINLYDSNDNGNFVGYNQFATEELLGNVFKVTADSSTANNIFKNILSTNVNDNYDISIKQNYSKLDIPVVTPITNKWEGIDLNVRGNKTELIWNMDNLLRFNFNNLPEGTNKKYYYSNFIPYTIENNVFFKNELLFSSYQYIPNDPNENKYIFNDINNIWNNKLLKENIVNSNNTAAINTLMYYKNDSFTTKFAIGYYNKFTDMFEFTISGIKFNINVNNLSYLQNVNFANYNNFLVTLILNPSRNRTSNNSVEFIINENTKSILIIWYQGKYNLSYDNREIGNNLYPIVNIGNSNKNGDMLEQSFVLNGYNENSYFQKERFVLNYDNLSVLNTNDVIAPIIITYDNTFKNNIMNVENEISTNAVNIFQFNNNIYYKNSFTKYYNSTNDLIKFNYNSTNNTIDVSVDSGDIMYYDGYNTFVVNDDNVIQQKIKYYFDNTTPLNTYETHTINYSYNIDSSKDVNERSCSYDLLIEQINNNLVDFYIIRPDSSIYINSFNESKSLTPINIKIVNPILNEFNGVLNSRTDASVNYYVHNGFFNPKMKEMFSFDFNESSDIINKTSKNYILCNTSVKSIENIPQLWINKVCSDTELTDFDNQTVSFDYIDNFNIFSSIWDSNYYYDYSYIKKVDDPNKNFYKLPEPYPGYLLSYENKSFFGSKCLVLKNNKTNGSFTIKKWISNNISITNDLQNYNNNLNTLKVYKIKINITQSFIDELLNNNTFVNNWNFINSNIVNNIIINYIKNSVIKYYTINNKNNLKIYYKSYNGKLIEYENDGTFINQLENNTTSISYENNQYYLNIEFPYNLQYTYYFEFKIDRKNNNE